MIRTIAPAKINWTLEVLGKHLDGYHEVRTVLQTIDVCDEITLEVSDALSLNVTGPHSATDDDHTLAAARLIGRSTGRDRPTRIHVAKRIPVGAGLGGGSSDAAAVLRGLRALYSLRVADAELAGLAAEIGSDTPFFLSGGSALGTGRGDVIERLPDAPEAWLVVLVPPILLADKTRRLYAALEASDFSDGQRTAMVAGGIRRGEPVDREHLVNAFDAAASRVFDGLEGYRVALCEASGVQAHLAGAGPGLFSVHATRAEAESAAARLEARQARVFVARTLGAGEATRVIGE